MNRDSINNTFYNAHAESFDKIPFHDVLVPLMLNYLPTFSCEILEIGSGAGALALWLSELGHQLTCIEPAEKQAEIARKKGLNVSLTRFQDFPIGQIFDSVVAISSLIHISRSEMPEQIKKIAQLLKYHGLFFVSFIEGNYEGYEDPTGTGWNRFFSKFTQEELSEILSPYFSVLEMQKVESKRMSQFFFLMVLQKKDSTQRRKDTERGSS